MACIGEEEHRGGEEDDKAISDLSVTLGISVVFSNSPLLVYLFGPESSN